MMIYNGKNILSIMKYVGVHPVEGSNHLEYKAKVEIKSLGFGKGFELYYGTQKVPFGAKIENNFSDKREININKYSTMIMEVVRELGVVGYVTGAKISSLVVTFYFKPLQLNAVAKIKKASEDISLALKANGNIRVMATKDSDTLSIEVPNQNPYIVSFLGGIKHTAFTKSKARIPLLVGEDVDRKLVVEDLTKLPHLLVGGSTNSGKSVGVNAMILSMVLKFSPDDLKLVLIDPKIVEFNIYEELPHLLYPIIEESQEAVEKLSLLVEEMENRYKIIKEAKCKKIQDYHDKGLKMPYIVVVVDELSDLLSEYKKEIEASLVRLAQKARGAGIHLIIATQRPENTVVTPKIKANLNGRLAYRTNQASDSNIILDQEGAENLNGEGDLLLKGSDTMVRARAPYISDVGIENLIGGLR